MALERREMRMNMYDMDAEAEPVMDPEDYCVNCGKKIYGMYRTCPFCGKNWCTHERDD